MTRAAPLLLLAAALACVPDRADGCAAIGPDGSRVDISGETALVVWDEANKLQHFIRRGSFQSTTYDFGFLVPTPNRPELDVAPEDVFGRLAAITAPKTETRTVYAWDGGCFKMSAKVGEDAAHGGKVMVLEQKRVGDYDAAVVGFKAAKGDDPAVGAEELAKWLRDHGYPFTPSLGAWLKPYVENKWLVTAFKIAAPKVDEETHKAGGKKGPVRQTTQPVRMSFKTDRPFYPYREPDEMRDADAEKLNRQLRVFFVGPKRYAGTLGGAAWPGKTVWANALGGAEVQAIGNESKLPAGLPSGDLWLTEFEDRSRPRPGIDEVYFEPAADQSAVARAPIIHVVYDNSPWLIGGGAGAVVGVAALVWAARRRK